MRLARYTPRRLLPSMLPRLAGARDLLRLPSHQHRAPGALLPTCSSYMFWLLLPAYALFGTRALTPSPARGHFILFCFCLLFCILARCCCIFRPLIGHFLHTVDHTFPFLPVYLFSITIHFIFGKTASMGGDLAWRGWVVFQHAIFFILYAYRRVFCS